MVRDLDAEQLFIDRGFRPARKDGLLLLVDKEDAGMAERETSSGIILRVPVGDTKRTTVVGVGDYIDGLSPGDRILIHKSYGVRIPHGFGEEHRLILVTWNQIEALIEDELCLE